MNQNLVGNCAPTVMSSGQRKPSWLEVGSVFIVIFVFAFLMMDRSIDLYDEGIILTGAMRVNSGDLIHRDFYANYGPAAFYFISWLFDIFGQHVMVVRVYDLLIRTAITVLAYTTIVIYSGRMIAFAGTAICVTWLSNGGAYGYPMYPSMLLSTAAALLMAISMPRLGCRGYPFAAGLLTGGSALFRYDIGFLTFVAIIASSGTLFYLSRRVNNLNAFVTREKVWAFTLGAAIPVFTILLIYYSLDAISSFVHDAILFPLEYYSRMRSLPFPNIVNIFRDGDYTLLAIYLPLGVCAVAFVGLLVNLIPHLRMTVEPGKEWAAVSARLATVIFLTWLVLAFYLKGIVRVSILHTQLAFIPAVVLFATLFTIPAAARTWYRSILISLATLFIVPTAIWAYGRIAYLDNIVINDLQGVIRIASATNHQVDPEGQIDSPTDPKVSTLVYQTPPYRAAAVDFVTQNTSDRDFLFVGVIGHDKIFVNDVSAYFLTGRRPVTKWHHFDPGLQTSALIQAEIAADIGANAPEIIWLEATWNGKSEPNESARSSGVYILDNYLRQNYIPFRQFGSILILQRNRAKEPSLDEK